MGKLFEDDGVEAPAHPSLIVDLGAYEGPLDVLLTLARQQKVDLARISILRLAEQFLAFIAEARALRLEIAADYLVMAAWLAYLKSRLLLPEPSGEDEPSGVEMAERLALQLRLLEAMRGAAERLMARDQLNRDVFPRGAPEGIRLVHRTAFAVSLYELLRAYGECHHRGPVPTLELASPVVHTIEAALRRMARLLVGWPEWRVLEAFLPPEPGNGFARRNALSATLSASLDLAKSGRVQLHQHRPFGPIFVRPQPHG
ncbi:MAG: segregation/condensation protein A [Alphaproteobacteria bacterium]|nr:segregation/condensation protein A [Alphaproteobacteria bacterium]